MNVKRRENNDMGDAAHRQQYRINAMHGHDVGIWVCEGSGLSLSPVLFMQALCPDPAPRPLLVKWKPATAPPKAFRKAGALPLVYSECGRMPPWPYHLHLFAPQAPIAQALEQTSGLQNWSWAVPVIGIIVIFNQRYDRPPSALSLNRLLNRAKPSQVQTLLAWVQDQHVPYVVAALGYGETRDDLLKFRRQHDLAAGAAVMPGPALADARRQKQGTSSGGLFSSVFEHQQLAFDHDFARAVLDRLLQLIEREP